MRFDGYPTVTQTNTSGNFAFSTNQTDNSFFSAGQAKGGLFTGFAYASLGPAAEHRPVLNVILLLGLGYTLLDTWFYPMPPGRPLPQLPVWLDTDLGVTLDLEASYEDTCRVLRIA